MLAIAILLNMEKKNKNPMCSGGLIGYSIFVQQATTRRGIKGERQKNPKQIRINE